MVVSTTTEGPRFSRRSGVDTPEHEQAVKDAQDAVAAVDRVLWWTVRNAMDAGATGAEVASWIGVSRDVVFRRLRAHGLTRGVGGSGGLVPRVARLGDTESL